MFKDIETLELYYYMNEAFYGEDEPEPLDEEDLIQYYILMELSKGRITPEARHIGIKERERDEEKESPGQVLHGVRQQGVSPNDEEQRRRADKARLRLPSVCKGVSTV